MRKFLVIVMILVCLLGTGCNSNNNSTDFNGDTLINSMEGEVIKAIDDSTIELKVLKSAGDKIKIGDSVIVHYYSIRITNKENGSEYTNYDNGEYKVKEKERFNVDFFDDAVEEKENEKYLDVEGIEQFY